MVYTSISELKEREGVSREKNLGLEVQVFEKKVERKRFYSSLLFFFSLFFFFNIIIEQNFKCCNLSNVL